MKPCLWLLSGLFFTGILSACNNNKKEPSGGPCKYETIIYPATLIQVKTEGSADLIFRIEDLSGTLYRDSVSWFGEKNSSVDRELIDRGSIQAGNKYIIRDNENYQRLLRPAY